MLRQAQREDCFIVGPNSAGHTHTIHLSLSKGEPASMPLGGRLHPVLQDEFAVAIAAFHPALLPFCPMFRWPSGWPSAPQPPSPATLFDSTRSEQGLVGKECITT